MDDVNGNDKHSTPLQTLEGTGKPRVRNEVLGRAETLDEAAQSAFERPENRFMYVVLAVVTAFILMGLGWYAATVSRTYGAAIELLAKPDDTLATWDRFLLMITFARAQDFGLVKGGALFLSFVVVTLGMLIVVRGTQVTYRLKLAHGSAKSALETSSPGLVMVTLGLGLALGVVMTQSTIDLKPADQGQLTIHTQGITQSQTASEEFQAVRGGPLPKAPTKQESQEVQP